MSAITKKAIYSKLKNDAQLIALLGRDELGNPAIFNDTMNQKLQSAGWSLPVITFREADGSADSRFVISTMDNENYDIEIWADTNSALVIPTIAVRIDTLLHNQTISVETGTVYNCERVTQIPDQYDSTIKKHFGLYRYRLIVSR